MLFRRWELEGILKSSMSAYIYTTIYTDTVSTDNDLEMYRQIRRYIFRIQLDEPAHLEDSCFCIVYLLVFHHG